MTSPAEHPASSSALSSRFFQLSLKSSPSAHEIITKWTDSFIDRYSETQRHYHTLSHVAAMLASFDQVRHLIQDPLAVQLAIFFHDWIYEPRKTDNEKESMARFEQFADAAGVSGSVRSKVVRYIECTIKHMIPEGDGEESDTDLELFLDFDLEVLSRGPDEYGIYAGQIRREYGHVSEEAYCRGRSAVLRSFLDRQRIYFSEYFHERGEDRARENMETEIASLEQKLTKE